MKIRSVTYFDSPGQEIEDEFLERSEKFQEQTRRVYQELGYELQTVRFASPPFSLFLKDLPPDRQIDFAVRLERYLKAQGYDYISIGPALPANPDSYSLIPDLIQATSATFCSGTMTTPGEGVNLAAVRACGMIIPKLATLDPNGFANLYFAALGNVPPGSPFFPAAYHGGGEPAFAVAVEGADLAVEAFRGASSLIEARSRLIEAIEGIGSEITRAARKLEFSAGAAYWGIDCSLAPFPDPGRSIGTALEELGVPRLGQHGSLAAAAFLADSIDRADFPRTGFSGLMLPVLEDASLAERAAQGILTIKDLLLYSAVCGTGLDTVPLPGDSRSEEIAALLLDLAALSLRLDKPLTARLMPIPGKKAGDPTEFNFAYFANSKVLSLESEGLSGLFAGDGFLDIASRSGS